MKNLLTLCIITIAMNLTAQDKSIIVEISPESVLMGNEFEVSFTIENADVKSFEAPAFKEFDLVGGPFSSSMMQIINGAVSSKQTYTYILAPKNPGKFYIEPAFAQLKSGGALETQAIEVKVSANPEGIKQNRQKKGSQMDDFFFKQPNKKPIEKLKPERKSYKI
jgi:hypothetical protein